MRETLLSKYTQILKGDYLMRNLKNILLSVVLMLMICMQPLQVQATDSWKPTPLPAVSVDTTFGDARYINPAWLTHKVTVSYKDKIWVTGMNAFQNIPVRLTNANGKIACTFLDTSVFSAFFSAINADLSVMTMQSNAPYFDNGAGSYIIQEGQTHYEAAPALIDWLSLQLSNLVFIGTCQDISLTLTPELLVLVSDSGDVITSSDFVVAGTCSTSYQTSGANRSNNIAVAASRLNNLVIMPGQVVSVSDTMLPRTSANGYKPAGVYLNGVHTTGMGGGVCQVSSTVYNAVMNAGLTVIERHPHSMPVSYLPKGQDAAIAAGYKDLKFRNDYTVPVVLQTKTSGKKLTVSVLVWDQSLAGRSYQLWSKQTGSLSANAYLTTYLNGKEVSTVFVGSSKYKPLRESGE